MLVTTTEDEELSSAPLVDDLFFCFEKETCPLVNCLCFVPCIVRIYGSSGVPGSTFDPSDNIGDLVALGLSLANGTIRWGQTTCQTILTHYSAKQG